MSRVRAKKHLGQHFLRDESIAAEIAGSLRPEGRYNQLLEIGPGMGVLTRFLLEKELNLKAVEIDAESVAWLEKHFPDLKGNIIAGDFLQLDLSALFNTPVGITGNFPYNISSQILFHALNYRDQVMEVTGMFQHEVAKRITSPPGSRDSGILSVLMQAYYQAEYLFTVEPHVFEPPPKVRSGVIRLLRNEVTDLGVPHEAFVKVVKTAFNQRRKMLRNALSQILPSGTASPLLHKRAEQLSVNEFITLTRLVEKL